MLEGATRITNLEGEEILHPINMVRLWKYHIWYDKKKGKKPARLKTQNGGLGKC